MSNLNYTDERAHYMLMLPYRARLPEAMLLRANETRAVNQLEDLASLRLVSVRGFSYHPEIMQALAARSTSKRIEVASIADGLSMVKKQRADALIAPVAATSFLIDTAPHFHFEFRKANLALTLKDHRFVYLAVAKPQAKWANAIEKAILSLQQDGMLEALYGPRERAISNKLVSGPITGAQP